MTARSAGDGGPLLRWQLLGVGLFLFIPLVLFLFVRHPEPVGPSLAAGVALMLGHRFLARPYMEAVREKKCLWCNGRPRPHAEPLPLLVSGARAGGSGAGGDAARGGELVAVTCPRHRDAAARFTAFLQQAGMPLRAGIFVPLLLLLAALLAAAFGERRWLDPAVALFQLLVGITVNVAAFGYLATAPVVPARLPFPAHNFFLLGIRNLLWVLRLVGIWWIVRGATVLLPGIR